MRFRQVVWHDELPSTNTHLRNMLLTDPGLPDGTVVAARGQSDGRGRFGKVWMTVPGKDLAFSCLLRTQVDLAWIPSLPMAAALAVACMLAEYDITARLKWPNDVLVNGRKICGILVEAPPVDQGAALVLGIGINVNMDESHAGLIDQPVTSMMIETSDEYDPAEVLDRFLPHLDRWVGRWEQSGFQGIREEWIAATLGIGKPAVVEQNTQQISGILEGFGDFGELFLRTPDGRQRMVWTGHLSVQNGAS